MYQNISTTTKENLIIGLLAIIDWTIRIFRQFPNVFGVD
jgi:hypothetical protein